MCCSSSVHWLVCCPCTVQTQTDCFSCQTALLKTSHLSSCPLPNTQHCSFFLFLGWRSCNKATWRTNTWNMSTVEGFIAHYFWTKMWAVAQFEEKYSVFNWRRSAELSADVPELSRDDQPHVALNKRSIWCVRASGRMLPCVQPNLTLSWDTHMHADFFIRCFWYENPWMDSRNGVYQAIWHGFNSDFSGWKIGTRCVIPSSFTA